MCSASVPVILIYCTIEHHDNGCTERVAYGTCMALMTFMAIYEDSVYFKVIFVLTHAPRTYITDTTSNR